MRLNKWLTKAVEITAVGSAIDLTYCGVYSISGSSASRTITSITGGAAGSWAVLLFTDGNVAITTAAAKLNGNATFTGAANDVLFLATYDGTTWAEAGRQQQAVSAPATTLASLTVTGATALNGGITCDSTAFTVADTSGNVATTGTLTVTGATALNGGITVDSTAFTVADTSGNVATTGTLTVTGATALNGGITVDSTAFTVADTSGNVATTGTLNVTGLSTLSGGIAAAGGFSFTPRLVHTGGAAPRVNTDGTDATPVITEVYIAEIFVPATMAITGVSIFNGSVAAGNIKVGLASSAGAVVATSASTAMSGTDAYQRVPFTASYDARGPATYFVLLILDDNSARVNCHTFGDFGAAKQTSQDYATGFTTITPPTTFTTALAPMASLY